jgi:DNA-binding transcriptional regulator LsrR (DeoR family)
VVGDIAGVVFRKEKIDKKQKDIFKKLKKRWTGIEYKHLEKCAQNALANSKPGVIVVASGEEKAQSIYYGIKNGLINKLFIDEKLANKLVELIENTTD